MLKTTIPFIDLRGKTPVDLLRAYPDKAHALLRASRRTFGLASHLASGLLLPFSDQHSRKWLARHANPYLHEIETMADIVGARGVVSLNVCYEWACTGGAYLQGEHVNLLRVMDWPFPGLGKHLVVALQSAPAGEFFNITWPALSGVYQGVAPGRFAAAINQAPMRKYGLGYAGDWLMNRVRVNREKGLPPSHVLRQVFEQASSYAEAKEMLCKAPLAIPAIFLLAGLAPGKGCIIERLEGAAEIMELSAAQCVSASNQFHSGFAQQGRGWRPREIDSAGRYRQSTGISLHDLQQEDFSWLRPPIINNRTRLVMLADASSGALRLQGFEGAGAVTEIFSTQARN